MAARRASMAASLVLMVAAANASVAYRHGVSAAMEAVPPFPQDELSDARRSAIPITVHPGTLGRLVDTLAGQPIRVQSARVVGVFDPRVFLIESQTALLPIVHRDRIVVFVEAGELRVEPALLVASTVTLDGVARTLLGMQVSREVPWPTALNPDAVKRLDIRAAILATAVRTPEGINLLDRASR